MTQEQLEKNITKELRELVNDSKIDWVEWSTSEQQVKKNLEDGEKMIKLKNYGVWVAYKPSGVREVNNHIKIEEWGKDHWSALAYIESLAVDHKGIARPDIKRMRCNMKKHPHLVGYSVLSEPMDGSKYPTKLKTREIENHDDWDCLDDAVAEGLLEDIGTGLHRTYKLTKLGKKVSASLRNHKADGKNFSEFVWVDE